MSTRPRARRVRILRAEPIRTQRLRLDPLRVDDAAELAGALADPALYRFLGGRAPDEEQLRRRYADLVEGSDEPGVSWCTWTVRELDGGRAVGMVQAVTGPDVGGLRAVISWMVGTAWQRRGYAVEAAQALVEWLRRRGVRTVTAHIDPRNTASAAVARSLGLVRGGDHHGEEVWTDRPRHG
ncbi:GNAT family N-acetyltransferase [Thermobifida alba]|uniref:GNAT family N-acetyltransferase n=1 Tax=Thermobifida alba TaxID=53522 RepID=A0ABY4L0T2_THEAE|nr:GNAT family N-acetyltransferase [Thermobifida alba]UPT20541.1 GNAT family N-acetyltransferase [Thermobifida alba]HLU99165.1 GNAT family N-acetyltransferase [Thermobifida alba]